MDDLVQGTDEWRRARAGSVGASQIADLMARTKSGYGASRATLMGKLIAERLTGEPQEGFTNEAMRWGTETEPQARSAYSFIRDVDVAEVGLVRHPAIIGTHASPDGLVGDQGMVEIKCPNTATHIDTLLTGTVPDKYVKQMQWQMSCAGRSWCDFVSFDPRMPGDLQLWIKPVERDDALIADIASEVQAFLAEMEEKIARLEGLRAAA